MAQDNSAAIAEIEAQLNSGVESVSVDGTATKVDFETLRKRLAELKANDADSIAAGNFRPRAYRVNMRNAW